MRLCAAGVATSASVARSAAIASMLAANVVPMPEWPGGAARLAAAARAASSALKP